MATRIALGLACPLFVSVLTLWTTCLTLHWPTVGDASLIHYVVFLLEKGYKPYSEIHDVNLPGAYLVDYLVVRIFGWSALTWRLFDITLCAFAFVGMTFACDDTDRKAGILAAGLFVLIHLRDGVAQLGQRDLTVSICEVLALGFLSAKRPRLAYTGLLLGLACIIKPTAIFCAPLIICYPLISNTAPFRSRARSALILAGAAAIVPFATAVWLFSRTSFHSFFEQLLFTEAHVAGARLSLSDLRN